MSRYVFNVNNKPRYFPPVVKYNGADIMSAENISTIIGKKKSRKTLMSLDIVRAAITGYSSLGFEVKKCPSNKKVYFFDTEMAKTDFYNSFRRLFNGDTPDNLMAVNINDMSHKQRREEVYGVNDAHIVFVDGVADLLVDYNDIPESREVVALMKRVAINNSCPIVLIQHLNPGDPEFVDKGRGNLGVEVANKCMSAIIVRNKGRISEARFSDTRNALIFDKFSFAQDGRNFVSLKSKDMDDVEREIIHRLSEDKVYSLKEISDLLDAPSDKVNKALRKMDVIKKISRGKYKLKNE